MHHKFILLSGIAAILLGLTACNLQSPTRIQTQEITELNTYTDLNVATYVTKIGEDYFINDCYHNQIIYHDNLEDALSQWKVLTDQVHYAHTLAGDGTVLLTDDTENNRVLVFTKKEEGYVQTQTIENIGMKPHFVQYCESRKLFLAWSSITGELYYLKRDEKSNEVAIQEVKKLDELYGVYVRSFTVIGDDIYFVSGHNNQKIIKADLDTLEIEETYPVPDQIAGMVQLVKIQDYFYLTVSTDKEENQDFATILRTKNLRQLADGQYEDIYDQFGLAQGTPYYITQIGDTYYMTHHRTDVNVISFEVINNEISNIQLIY